jgi:hypothetical protein
MEVIMKRVVLILMSLTLSQFALAAPDAVSGSSCVADSTLAAIGSAETVSLYRMGGELVVPAAKVAEILAQAEADSQVQARLFPEPGMEVGYIGRAAKPMLDPAEREEITALVSRAEALRCGPEDRLECAFAPQYGLVFTGPAATILVLVGYDCRTVTFTDSFGHRIGGGTLDEKTAAHWHETMERAAGQ